MAFHIFLAQPGVIPHLHKSGDFYVCLVKLHDHPYGLLVPRYPYTPTKNENQYIFQHVVENNAGRKITTN